MASLLDTVVGLGHFLADRVPSGLPSLPPKPRRENLWRKDGKPLVSRVKAGADLRVAIEESLELLGGLGRLSLSGKRTFVKPNFNSADPFPGSTDLGFLRAAVELLLEAGVKVSLGECSGGVWRPTRRTLARAGVPELARSLGVELIAFEDRPKDWVRLKIPGEHLREVTVPRAAYEAEVMIYLPCLKTHRAARFTLSLKLAVGFMHPGERRSLHMGSLEEKVAELNLIWQPDLILMDGRKAFVAGGPEVGEMVEPGLILASGDLVALDLEALKTLKAYEAQNQLNLALLEFPQIATALKHGLGEPNYLLMESGG